MIKFKWCWSPWSVFLLQCQPSKGRLQPFSCAEQLKRWPCHSPSHSLTHSTLLIDIWRATLETLTWPRPEDDLTMTWPWPDLFIKPSINQGDLYQVPDTPHFQSCASLNKITHPSTALFSKLIYCKALLWQPITHMKRTTIPLCRPCCRSTCTAWDAWIDVDFMNKCAGQSHPNWQDFINCLR